MKHQQSNQFPQPLKTAKKWVLKAGNQVYLTSSNYRLLTWMRNDLAAQGIRFLTIKPTRL